MQTMKAMESRKVIMPGGGRRRVVGWIVTVVGWRREEDRRGMDCQWSWREGGGGGGWIVSGRGRGDL